MKRILLLSKCLFVLFSLCAQTGPGGVGSSANNILWLNADSLNLNNNDAVSTWTDLSGNSNNATQGSSGVEPTFKTNAINGRPWLSFDGGDFLALNDHITSGELTFFTVFRSTTAGPKTIFASEKHLFEGRNINAFVEYAGTTDTISKIWVSPSIFTVSSEGTAAGDFSLTCDRSYLTDSRTNFNNLSRSLIGALPTSLTRVNALFKGGIPELIVFNEELDSASRNIIINYLSTKYNAPAFNDLYTFDSSYPHDLIGIGKEISGENSSARSGGRVEISNASSLDNGDYLLSGHNNAGYGTNTNVPIGVQNRWNQVWRVDQTGDIGTVSLEFFLDGVSFASVSDYAVLIETDDGDFSNDGVSIHTAGRTYNPGSNSITFTGVNLQDSAYFTLAALVSSEINSVATGSWKNPNNWDCTCIPDTNDLVTIVSPHTISIDSNANVTDLTIENGASLEFDGFDTLSIFKNMTFELNSSLIKDNGTIAAISSTISQEFTNNSGNIIDLNNLYVSNSSSLNLISGGWAIHNNLQVKSGILDATSADSVILVSTSTSTSQILPSKNDAFTGDFIIQRYIGTRNANYSNIGSPIENATVADLDDDLFLSGVNGSDGNALKSDGSIFYSIWTYYPNNGQTGALQSTLEPLYPGQGYEVYLADNLSTFNAKVIDFVGTPNSGELDSYLLTQNGWNLFANHFHAHVAYDSVDKVSWVPNEYYIFNTNNGSYDLITGQGKPLLAPGQGFWINTNSPGKSFEIKEEDKVSSSSSSFLRQKNYKMPYFNLTISNQTNDFKHQMAVNFKNSSVSGIDESDAFYLKSPIEEAPAIYSYASNSSEELVLNSLSSLESSHLIPVSIFAGVNGQHEIKTDNINQIYKNYSCIFLKDQEKGVAIDLLVEDSYRFQAKKGNSDRFSLILSNSYQECEDLIAKGKFEQKLENKLSLRNTYNRWYLDYTLGTNLTQVEIRIYNINGQEVVSPVSFSASDSGSYPIQELQELNGVFMVRIITGSEILNKTIKL